MSPHLCALALSAIRSNPHTRQLAVEITAQDECLVLDGVVRSYYQKQMAQEVIKQIAGVQQIRNEVSVAAGQGAC
jgi:osmotically-inducible protein OsmY